MTTLVKPFAALRPEAEHASAVIAPPYDVVSRAEAQTLVTTQPNSFLRISRPEIELSEVVDIYSDEIYARGAENFERLTTLGFLKRDTVPSYYIYRMRMGKHEQTGVALIASIAAYNSNRIRKHERTRPDKETDRVRNITSLNAQTGPVLSVYQANASMKSVLDSAKQATPVLDVNGQYDVKHTLWQVDDPSVIETISSTFNAMDAIYIADGHHRSAAASRVAAERSVSNPGKIATNADFFLTVVFPHDEMNILDYNRVIKDLNGLTAGQVLDRLSENFQIDTNDTEVKPERTGCFGMYIDGSWYRLAIRTNLIPENDPVGRLDVSLLQDRILSPILNVGDPRLDPRVNFVGGIRGLQTLANRVDSNEAAIAFSLHPTSMEQLMAVADAQKLMPPKSTWFEPKLADGLLTHVLD